MIHNNDNIVDKIFNNHDRIGMDNADETQRNLANTRYTGYILDNYMSSVSAGNHIDVATQMPNVNFRGNGGGVGIPGKIIDFDSLLTIKYDQEHHFEKLQLNQRPFATVPYLGRGSVNTDLETLMKYGYTASDKKSLTTMMDKPYIDYSTYPLLDEVKSKVTDPSFSVEEVALDGWVRGGIPSREMSNDAAFSRTCH